MISKEKIDDLKIAMERLQIKEDDLIEKFILGSGRGGQKLQKTSSCVWIKHIPTGLEVKCQKARSRELNRYYARRELIDKLDQEINDVASKKQMEFEKIRRQKKRRTRKNQEKMLDAKKRRGEIKENRSTKSDQG